jgi:hypothetical protein
MYAHQAIEDLDSVLRSAKSHGYEDSITKLFKQSITDIQKSQKFHVGSIEHLANAVKIMPGAELFMDRQSGKLPFKLCWFDWTVLKPERQEIDDRVKDYGLADTSAEAVLVEEIFTGIYNVSAFTRFITRNSQYSNFFKIDRDHWGMNPVRFQVVIGKGCRLIIPHGWDVTDELIELCKVEMSINCTFLDQSLKLLNCKNISTEVIKAPEALNKKRRKNGKQEIFDYRILNVTMPGKKQGYREQNEPLSHNRVHLCRGHFKEYTQEHPLFGKYTGLYWWQPHVRGQNKEGIVMKDYNVRHV